MSRYVPPALRNQQAFAEVEIPIARNPKDGYSIGEIRHQFDYQIGLRTLNGNDQQIFILLFDDHHPQWPSKIFCKSNLHLLPSLATNSVNMSPIIDCDGSPESNSINGANHPTKPIAVFISHEMSHRPLRKSTRSRHNRFLFAGTFEIASIEYLESHSEQLVKMLEIKWAGGKQGYADLWDQSLAVRWAVVELQRDDKNEANPMIPLRPVKRKGVTELLEELRLKELKTAQKGVMDNASDQVAALEGMGPSQQLDAEKHM